MRKSLTQQNALKKC
jgi:hypothetical protein